MDLRSPLKRVPGLQEAVHLARRMTNGQLDSGLNGQPFKPDSLYVEVMKP
jgi:hypothetical protein